VPFLTTCPCPPGVCYNEHLHGSGIYPVALRIFSLHAGCGSRGLNIACQCLWAHVPDGVPFTSISQLIPFVVFGIGLDDVFIFMGSYERTDRRKETVDRIEETVKDIGLSITLTSLTSAVAFGTSAISSVPAVQWLSLYSFPAVIFVFVYQMTCFVACIALDDERVRARRRDICCWVKVERAHAGAVAAETDENNNSTRLEESDVEHFGWCSFILLCSS
jgi:Sterol-sensing domain of SREBP cleavage-activation